MENVLNFDPDKRRRLTVDTRVYDFAEAWLAANGLTHTLAQGEFQRLVADLAEDIQIVVENFEIPEEGLPRG